MPDLTEKMSLKEAGKLFLALDEIDRNTGKVSRFPRPECMRGTYLVVGVGEATLHFSYERKKEASEQITCDWFCLDKKKLEDVKNLISQYTPKTQKDIERALKKPSPSLYSVRSQPEIF